MSRTGDDRRGHGSHASNIPGGGVEEDGGAEARQHLSCLAIELEDRVRLWVGIAPAVQTATAPVIYPEVAIGADVDASVDPHSRPSGRVSSDPQGVG